MKKNLSIIFILIIAASCFAQDYSNYHVTKNNYLFAYTEKDLDLATELCAEKDTDALQQMIDQNRVIIVKEGLSVSIVKSKLTKYLVRFKGTTLELWTVREAIQ